LSSLLRGLGHNGARTDRRSRDDALRGRTYAIPYDRVWTAALQLASGKLGGWAVVRSDDQMGVLDALASPRLFGPLADVRVRIGLDSNGQTRVDAEARSRTGRGDWGENRRRIRRFMAALDRKLEATPAQILDGTRESSLTA
jgi:hypothetical protein